ncbi:LysM peptidoglycan-binding domain-containing protein [Sporolactobacillus vineae]|uniref:LysM peptidoglycan-binding domain-containing protein n=1 Tax=Sporolactobacillus vineae TaxID=444463 RepID=UPI000288CEC1|nr:LysM peptidoglycan-binding domain-containing protein [Sporolactobacillus vineae]
MKKMIVPAVLAGGFFLSVSGQSASAATGQEIINRAIDFKGTPMNYGAPAFSTASFDCSSFTQYIYKTAAGITLPRTAAQQATRGTTVDRNHLQPGDLLFFDISGNGRISHVGIYIGNGQMISTEDTFGVHVTNVFSGGHAQVYWEPRFVLAKRILDGKPAAQTSSSASLSSAASVAAPAASAYTVKSGDSLWAIATAHGTSVKAIKQANGLRSNLIYPGQQLKLSGSASSGATAEKTSSAPAPSSGQGTTGRAANSAYTVKSGDSLWAIAAAHSTSVKAIKQANGLRSDLIYPGQQLKLTGSAPATSSAQKAAARTASVSGGSYQVKSGDNLWTIATLNGITVNKLMRLNHLSSTLIYPGQHLVLPA